MNAQQFENLLHELDAADAACSAADVAYAARSAAWSTARSAAYAADAASLKAQRRPCPPPKAAVTPHSRAVVIAERRPDNG